MTLGEIKYQVMFQTNNDFDDIADFEPHIIDYINEAYDRLIKVWDKCHTTYEDGKYPKLMEDTDVPLTPEWTHRYLADWATWLVYRNGNPQKQQRGLAFRQSFESFLSMVADEGAANGLDENGNQKVRIRKGKGAEKLWVRISIPANDWNDRTKAEEWRASWAACCNRYLSKDKKLDHRSYKRQGRDIEPTVHEGVTARKMERKGKLSERCEVNRNIKNRNRILEGIRDLTKEIKDYILEKVRPVIEGIRRSVSAAKGEGRYYRIDPVFGGRYRCSRERSERHRETAGRIDQIKRGIEETEREIESTNREIEITDRDIKNYIRKNEIYKRYLHRTDRRVEGREPIAVEPPDAKIVEADFPAPAVPGPEHMEPDPIMIEIHVPKAAEQKKPAPFTHRDYDHTEEKEYTPGL